LDEARAVGPATLFAQSSGRLSDATQRASQLESIAARINSSRGASFTPPDTVGALVRSAKRALVSLRTRGNQMERVMTVGPAAGRLLYGTNPLSGEHTATCPGCGESATFRAAGDHFEAQLDHEGDCPVLLEVEAFYGRR
jgi:hypothetical protein